MNSVNSDIVNNAAVYRKLLSKFITLLHNGWFCIFFQLQIEFINYNYLEFNRELWYNVEKNMGG